jgi:DNA-binding response OmpR family regulator
MTVIALIEDNIELQEMTASFLRGQGYHVRGVAAAEELAELNETPDFYLIDLNLPTLSGYELISRIRQTAPHVGIIVTTARERTEDITRGYEIGADVYLTKPIDPDLLLAAVKRLEKRTLHSPERPDAAIVYPSTRILMRNSEEVRLSEAECRLLYQLSLAGTDGLERWEVMELLGMDLDHDAQNTLEVRITRLRGKLRAVGLHGEVLTAVRSRGYRLAANLEFL